MMNRRRVILVALIAGIASAVVSAALLVARAHRQDRECEEHLRRIYAAVAAYAEETHRFPELALYPDDPMADPDSLLIVLRPFGIEESDLLCPATDASLQATGNTYLWNTRLSGKSWSDIDAAQWMVVEMNAMSSRVPAPHHQHYHVLYTDGEVRSEKNPPAVL